MKYTEILRITTGKVIYLELKNNFFVKVSKRDLISTLKAMKSEEYNFDFITSYEQFNVIWLSFNKH